MNTKNNQNLRVHPGSIKHPAALIPFDELLATLREYVDKRAVMRRIDPTTGFELFIYRRSTLYDKAWDRFTICARGLILDPINRRVVAYPLPKFFNLMERPETQLAALPDEPYQIDEKLDGSLAIIFHDGARWRVSTKGSFDSDAAALGQGLLASLNMGELVPGTTYLAEMVSKETRIVIQYDKDALYLLTAYAYDGEEADVPSLDALAPRAGFLRPSRLEKLAMPDLINLVRALPEGQEGYVLRFASGLRVKIKGEAYCRLHQAVSKLTPLTIHEMLYQKDNLDEMRMAIPEEFLTDFDEIRRLFTLRWDEMLADIECHHARYSHVPNPKLASQLAADHISKPMPGFLFARRRDDYQVRMDDVESALRRAMFEHIRPIGNKLPGYKISTLLTRFADSAKAG